MNFSLCLHNHPELISDSIREKGYWETPTTEILIEAIKNINKLPDNDMALFIDVGANLGYFSFIAASHGIKSIAFEPVQKNFNCIVDSVLQNPDLAPIIYPVKIALGTSTNTTIDIKVFPENMGYCTTRDTPNDVYSHIEKVSCTRFDDFFRGTTTKYYIVKINVEHMEEEVLMGMYETMKTGKIKYIIVEVASYTQNLIDIMKQHAFNTVVNIGYDKHDKTSPNTNTNYLQKPEYRYSLEDFQKVYNHELCMTNQNLNINPQRILLFIHDSMK